MAFSKPVKAVKQKGFAKPQRVVSGPSGFNSKSKSLDLPPSVSNPKPFQRPPIPHAGGLGNLQKIKLLGGMR